MRLFGHLEQLLFSKQCSKKLYLEIPVKFSSQEHTRPPRIQEEKCLVIALNLYGGGLFFFLVLVILLIFCFLQVFIKYSVGCWYLSVNMGVLVSWPGDHSDGFLLLLRCPKKILGPLGPGT